jgi:PAS domain S-box-containing protein
MSAEPEESGAEERRSSLRQRAEAAMQRLGNSGRIPEAEDLASLLQELTIHQIELEMQGEELRRSSDALASTKKLYFLHFQAAPVPIIRFTHDGCVIETNLAGWNLLGVTPRAGSGKPRRLFERLLGGGELARLRRLLSDAGAAEGPVQADITINHASLGERVFAVTALAVPQTDGPQILTYFQDDTLARKKSADFERLSLIARHTENMVIFTGTDRKITWVNDGFVELTGYTLDEVRGKSPAFLQGIGTDQATVGRMRAALNDGEPVREEILNFTKSGRPYWAAIEIIPRRDSQGTLIGFMSIQRDVTHRRNREDQLVKLRTAVEQSANTIVITDTLGHIEYVNPAFERTTGYAASEVLGKNPRILASGEQSADFYRDLWGKITGGQTWKGTFHNRRKDGSLFWESATISPVLDSSGRTCNYIAVKENISARISAEQALANEHNRLVQVLEAASEVMIIATDRTGTITVFNRGACNILGYSEAEVVGKESPTLFHDPEEVAARAADLSRELGREISGFEVLAAKAASFGQDTRDWTHITKGGGRLTVSLVVTALHDADGAITGFLGIGQDVTAARAAELALRESEELLEQTGQVAGVGGWTLDLAANVPRWTAQTRHIHEVGPDYTPGSVDEALAFYDPEFRPLIRQGLTDAVEKGIPFHIEARFTTAKGRKIWVRAIAHTQEIKDRPKRLLGTFQDITTRKKAELALENERQRLANVIDGTGLGTWEWNIPNGDLVINERWADICGYKRGELAPIGIGVWRRLVHPDDLALAEEALQSHFGGHLPMYDVVFRMRHKSGQWVWVRSAGRIIDRTPEGLPLMMYGTHTDITRDKLREEAIREANSRLKAETERAEAASRAKGDFLANMSHEIRTPLNAIIGMSELLENDPTGPDAREFLHTIRNSGDALLALINDILDFSKIEAGQLDLERVPVNLRACAEAAVNTISLAAARRSLRVVLEMDPALPPAIIGDPLRLRQILINLLNNAVKFTEEGEIELRIFRSGDSQIGFAVRDTGIGITPEQQEKLFQSFSQADSSTTRRFGGTGLGLAISRKLVEMMGGAIRVDSGQGVGSTFHFAIPLVKANDPGEKSGKKPSGSQPDAQLAARIPMSILVVEDNLVNQRLVEMMLRRLGYSPALAANGLEALAALEKSRFDLVFMDIQMPEMDGLLATRKICEIHPPETRPQIVALTANAMDGDREVCLAAGMNDYLAKPVRHEHLAGAIERAAVRAGILKTR